MDGRDLIGRLNDLRDYAVNEEDFDESTVLFDEIDRLLDGDASVNISNVLVRLSELIDLAETIGNRHIAEPAQVLLQSIEGQHDCTPD